MNDITISWKRIYATFPEIDNTLYSRGWNKDEIQKMLKFARGPIERTIILIAASSGILIGGFDLNWGDIRPIYKNGSTQSFDSTKESIVTCAMLTIYQGTSARYPAFITPEAYEAVCNYRDAWTREVGRMPLPEDPVFKKDGTEPAKASIKGIKKRVERTIGNVGLRYPEHKIQRRFEVPMMNSFRRFWNKACKESLSNDSPLASLIKKEYMMGHAGLVSLDKNYFKTHNMELAEEYICAVPNLTIDDSVHLAESNRLKNKKIAEVRG